MTAQTLPDEPDFRFVPAHDLEAGVQQVRSVIEGLSGHVPTALVTRDLDDAHTICDKLNRRLGHDHEAWIAMAAASIRHEDDGPEGGARHPAVHPAGDTEGPAPAGPSSCSGSWHPGEEIPDPAAVFNTPTCDRAASSACRDTNPRLFPFLPPSPADRSGGVVVIPRSGVFSGACYELGEPIAHLAPPCRA